MALAVVAIVPELGGTSSIVGAGGLTVEGRSRRGLPMATRMFSSIRSPRRARSEAGVLPGPTGGAPPAGICAISAADVAGRR